MNDYPGFHLTDRVALVTGAARGLGHAISLALANAGAHLALGLRDSWTSPAWTRSLVEETVSCFWRSRENGAVAQGWRDLGGPRNMT